jgi:hypothetical protein
MSSLLSPLILFLFFSLATLGLGVIGPAEAVLGEGLRAVYLHGAWVWTALLAIGASGLLGIAAWVGSRPALHRWSTALGQAGLIFWWTYLPLSLWAMQLNWNGLFLQEPRWRVAVDFAIAGSFLQLAILLLRSPRVASALNAAYAASLGYALLRAGQVMHPPSPVLTSNSWRLIGYFMLLLTLCAAAALQLARWFRQRFKA